MTFWHFKHVNVLIGRESPTTWGTAVTANKDIGLIQDITINAGMNWTKNYTVGEDINAQDYSSGRGDITGSCEVILQHGRLIEYMTGLAMVSAQHVTTDDPDFKHNFVDSTYKLLATRQSFTMDITHNAATDSTFQLVGVVPTTMTFSLGLDGYLRCRFDFVAKNIDPSGTVAGAATVDTIAPFKDFMATLSWGTASSEVAQKGLQSFDFTINNMANGNGRIWGAESKVPLSCELTGRDMSFRFTMAFQDVLAMQDLLGATDQILDSGVEIAKQGFIFDVTNSVAAQSGLRQFYLDCSGVVVNTVSQPVRIGGYIIQEFAGFVETVDNLYTYDDINEASWG